MKLVDYIAATELPLPPIRAQMYEYVTAANGVFVRGWRTGLDAMLPVIEGSETIRGLEKIVPVVLLDYPCVPANLVRQMFDMARADSERLTEMLFHLIYDDGWMLVMPQQTRSPTSVIPNGHHAPSYADALIEVHSHHNMPARFSSTDDIDETGFKIYVVLGSIFTWPAMRVRVGLYGHRWEIPASEIFDLPAGVVDAKDA